jgi:hypothetical protein
MTAGATSTVCTIPLWVIKTRFQVFSTSIFYEGQPYSCNPDAVLG